MASPAWWPQHGRASHGLARAPRVSNLGSKLEAAWASMTVLRDHVSFLSYPMDQTATEYLDSRGEDTHWPLGERSIKESVAIF